MSRIFLSLSVVGTLFLIVAIVMGLNIEEAKLDRDSVANHMLVAMGALVFALLVHAILLTYFMGTGRWLEETSKAYQLSPDYCAESSRLKYSALPTMAGMLLLLILTGASGAAADPLAAGFSGAFGLTSKEIHFLTACLAVGTNVIVNIIEYLAIQSNGRLVKDVLAEVQRIRQEHGLPV